MLINLYYYIIILIIIITPKAGALHSVLSNLNFDICAFSCNIDQDSCIET
jgi:hypothetical protein